jgi:K+-transporting ATPase c subunit
VASARNFNADQRKQLQQLIKDQIESPQFLFLGEARINVLCLNLEVDKIK